MELKYILPICLTVIVLFLILFGKTGSNPSRGGSIEQDIVDALKSGDKISAIKHYRYVHNVGLKDAKNAIDEMQKTL